MKKLLSVFCSCLFSQLLLAQITFAEPTQSYQQLKTQLTEVPPQLKFFKQIQQFNLRENKKNTFILMKKETQQMPAVYAYKDLAFFCKIEVVQFFIRHFCGCASKISACPLREHCTHG